VKQNRDFVVSVDKIISHPAAQACDDAAAYAAAALLRQSIQF
jgi:hypothetical protein